ncbi:MAG: hypothetical protein L3J09_02880 [Flavobacteriaceae bacterium]|nr:hypothetical protein [Flavobacteriaceae bacterium]
MNKKRIEYGLLPITENWKLDSTILQRPNRGFDCFLEHTNDTTYRFLENKWYCQYWANEKLDITKPYLKNKEIYFTKSFWIWENELIFEVNTYINSRTQVADFVKLETTSLLEDETLLSAHLSHIRNGEDILADYEFNSKMFNDREHKVDSILKQWKIK